MAYEHGSIDLGIPNPFKFEGSVRSVRGLITSLLGLYLLLKVPELVKEQPAQAWTYVAVGVGVLSYCLAVLGRGLMQLMRFYVGRSVPTSLADNQNGAESDTARKEAPFIAYKAKTLLQMLEGQKNLTFMEPQGWIARLIHTLFPRLTYLPFPVRNVAQRIGGGIIKTVIALLCFTLAWFISSAGLIGEAGGFVIQTFSVLLLVYLLAVWWRVGPSVSRKVSLNMETVGSRSLALMVMMAIVAPVLIGMFYSSVVAKAMANPRAKAQLETVSEQLSGFAVGSHLWAVLALAALSCGLLLVLVRMRSAMANPLTDVSSERGGNWQKDVNGPKEIYNQMKNGVMVKRWQLEVPNRIYHHGYHENTDTKEFSYELLEETQPTFEPLQYPKPFQLGRMAATVLSQLMLLGFVMLLVSMVDDALALARMDLKHGGEEVIGAAAGLWSMLFVALMMLVFGRLLMNLSHLFWAEISFQSMLIYSRAEGTYQRRATRVGKAVHDSRESEGEVTRVSVNPVVLVSRLFSVTYAGVGAVNLEWPRHVLEMHKDQAELEAIIGEMHGFFDTRSAHGGVTNEEMSAQVQSQGNYVERMVAPAGGAELVADARADRQALPREDEVAPDLPLGDEPA